MGIWYLRRLNQGGKIKILKFKASAVGLVTLLLASSLVTPNSSIAQGALQKATVLEVQDGDTIDVRFEDGRREPIRYVEVSAPELNECFGPEAKGANEQLVLQKEVWLEMNPLGDARFQQDRGGRILAYVWRDPETTDLIHVRLAKSGHLGLDPREVKDRDVRDNPSFFPVRYAEQIIAAQIAAAGQRLGWWGNCDPYRSSDLAIALIKFWGDEEIAYIVNRGNQPIDIGQGWEIRDSTDCNQLEIDIYWTGNTIWDNDGDKARLFNPEGTLVYEYLHPPRGP